MKKTLIKLSFYVAPTIILLLILGSFGDGNTDDNYLQFTSKADNIILGDSRGAQAVVPYILDKNFSQRKFDNFSLNIQYSPYGEIYLEGLKRKLKPDTKNGIFILTVDPWNLSQTEAEKDIKNFSEYNSPLNDVYFYTSPNYEYLLKHFPRSWYHIYRDREEIGKSNTFLHRNGWLEVNVDMHPEKLAARIEKKKIEYEGYANNYRHSTYRVKYFEEIINYLKNHGNVYIVRIPASEQVMRIEHNYWKNFNGEMKSIATIHDVPYFDFSAIKNDYVYTDGSHMYKESSKIFTQQIADSIRKYRYR